MTTFVRNTYTRGNDKMTAEERMQSFDDFWNKDGQYVDPDTDDVPWFDKRKSLAEYVWKAALASAAEQKVPEGYKLVPVEPTGQMLMAGAKPPGYSYGIEDAEVIWEAMLAAAPEAQ